ncbi:MBL fold metallo-hydrolase [Sulfuriflexus mobilis]|uniref:MBL fold metallo-hydrolase n=1 Tax=Sulfuriflexus mobilis TaxID=1811807 RepID=UPI000F83091C|nr:MBL fold metallo-hydrolase [Sulfuriflexus mobilis]
MLSKYLFIAFLMLLCSAPLQAKTACGEAGVWLQVLGSGGPELDDGRASSGYVVWHNGKTRLLIDMGAGSLFRFEQSGASLNDLDVILLSHMHVDHSNDLPALIKASYFTDRNRDLPVYGPTGNRLMPSVTTFVQDLFGAKGAFRYLSDYLDGRESYRLLPHDIEASGKAEQVVMRDASYRLTAVPVHHGPIPALAWRVEIGGHSLVFSGDMSNQNKVLAGLAKQADLLVAHHAIPERAGGIARSLHMPPSVIGQIAAEAGVKQLVLSHRMNRTLGQEQASAAQIRHAYTGPLQFANDLQCFRP